MLGMRPDTQCSTSNCQIDENLIQQKSVTLEIEKNENVSVGKGPVSWRGVDWI